MAGGKIIPLFGGGCKDDREAAILAAVRMIERRSGRVYPWMVSAMLDERTYLCEQTVRRRMADMARRGMLNRLGERKGYQVAA